MSELFGSLGGLMKGLSNFMPQDDPNTQLFKLQAEVTDLKKKENDLYARLGRAAEAQYGLDGFGELADQLRLVQSELAENQQKLNAAKAEAEAREQAAQQAAQSRTCPQCGWENPEGTKFCQECGTQMSQPSFCPNCGQQNPSGTRFCGGCGTKL